MKKNLLIKLSILALFLSSTYIYLSGSITIFQQLKQIGYANSEIIFMMSPLHLDTVVADRTEHLKTELNEQYIISSEYIGVDLVIDTDLALKQQLTQAVYQNQSNIAYYHTMLSIVHVVDISDLTLKSAFDGLQNRINFPNHFDERLYLEFDEKMALKGITSIRSIILVNKQHPLSPDYYPGEDPQAAASINALIQDMQALGFDVSSSYSGFRSFETQTLLYNNYVQQFGQAKADTFSARPGYSEHQTGLAFDLLNTQGGLLGSEGTQLEEVAWLQANAASYGFIIRYPLGMEHITGYMYEPWHLRYVGDVAQLIVQSGLTLEAFLGVSGADY